ncbi:Reverse transcriptase (RNA-dependent DNA polymerase) [Nesidiocoris tenuis]|uniref:Reverse transcriptase (RNA-dependent DNA polymerase) n=2 Tax=Nesidiocoris tenuis TaxID=355587 RepID=A0ABN7AFZ7_9HEMI|nr:Reverse transcriptase (RNA-dependent DNA polymerase) [Nesidiocoris tenuis]
MISYYDGMPIAAVGEYKYLGVSLTPSLNLGVHFRRKAAEAKHGLGMVWGDLIQKRNVSMEVKDKVFNASTRAIVGYGAQVWGFLENDQAEILHRFYLRKLFRLPQNTPKYILYKESGREPLRFYFENVHVSYVQKVLKLPETRYVRLVADEVMAKRISWFGAYVEKANRMSQQVLTGSLERSSVAEELRRVIRESQKAWANEIQEKVLSSLHHRLYASLDHSTELGRSYLRSSNLSKIRWIFKARAEMLNLNYKWWDDGQRSKCSLCNLDVYETTSHFLAICPVLGEFRQACFGEVQLTEERLIFVLNNGRDQGEGLVDYVVTAGKYRQFLVDQFNYD